MTNIEDGDGSRDTNPRMAALLAVHLVRQVLDEAYVIANAARDSGEPWRYLSMLKSFTSSKCVTEEDPRPEDVSFEASKGDCDQNETKVEEVVANVVATSTPQKLVARVAGTGAIEKSANDTNYIGQGDEDLEMQENELATSTFINHLFDMSDVERFVCHETETLQNTSEPTYLSKQAMDKIMETCVNQNFIPLENFNLVPNVNINDENIADLSKSEHSDYSLLADAFTADINRDVAFYIDDDKPYLEDETTDKYQNDFVDDYREVDDICKRSGGNQRGDIDTQEMIKKNVALYERAYATLNRDYDQGSDDEFPVLQDPKGMVMQEVELMTANTSDDDLSYPELNNKKPKNDSAEKKIKVQLATDSTISGSRKSTLARRCRLQGARLLSCFRGWWRRRNPEQYSKDLGPRISGVCPLSPEVRRRTSSLLDNRRHRSPSPSHPVSWKFNTVNEAVVNSNRWKEYTFDAKHDQPDQY